MDVVDRNTRSQMMSGIRGKNTQPEMTLRKYLHACGFRYRLHVAGLPGKPDLVLPRYRLCIFVHGCFWHRHSGCRYVTTPKTNTEFWMNKFSDNQKRDDKVRTELLNAGWRVFEIWECGFKSRPVESLDWLPGCIKGGTSQLSWPDYS